MLRKLLKLFLGPSKPVEILPASLERGINGELTSSDMHIATAALLVQVASIDDSVVRTEAEAICSSIEYNLNIPRDDIPALVEIAVVARRSGGKMEEFIAKINSHFSSEQRIRLLAMLWKIVLADEKVERPEERIVIKIRNQLKLTLEQGQLARKFAEEGKV